MLVSSAHPGSRWDVGLWGFSGVPGHNARVPLCPGLFFQLRLPAVLCSVSSPTGKGSLLREGPVQSGQRVRVKVKGMVSLELPLLGLGIG